MAVLDLTKYGITGTTEIVHNPSWEFLYEEEMKPELEGFDKGVMTELGAVNVMTGIFTGRSPKDKYIVMDENSKDTVWWTTDEYKNDNHPMSEETWAVVKNLAKKELSNKRLFVVDCFCGANKDSRMAVRFIMEVAWQAHFIKNMFIILQMKNWRPLSRISFPTTLPRQKSRIIRNSALTPRLWLLSTSPAMSRSS